MRIGRVQSTNQNSEVVVMKGITGGADRNVKFIEWVPADEGQPKLFPYRANVHDLMLKSEGVNDVQIRKDGRAVAIAGWDHKIRFHSWQTKQALAVFHHHTDGIQVVKFSPDTMTLAAGSTDARVSLWNLGSAHSAGWG